MLNSQGKKTALKPACSSAVISPVCCLRLFEKTYRMTLLGWMTDYSAVLTTGCLIRGSKKSARP